MIILTYAFGTHTGGIVVENWKSALDCIAAWTLLDKMDYIRIQYFPKF